MQEQFLITDGCYNIPTPCPNPLVWGVVGLIVGVWLASALWLVYIDYNNRKYANIMAAIEKGIRDNQNETEDEE